MKTILFSASYRKSKMAGHTDLDFNDLVHSQDYLRNNRRSLEVTTSQIFQKIQESRLELWVLFERAKQNNIRSSFRVEAL